MVARHDACMEITRTAKMTRDEQRELLLLIALYGRCFHPGGTLGMKNVLDLAEEIIEELAPDIMTPRLGELLLEDIG